MRTAVALRTGAFALATLLLLALPARAEDEKEKLLKGVRKALLAGDADAVARHFPAEGKIQLRLKGIKAGRYRDGQARSLLATYLGKIEPKEYELGKVRGTVGTFRMKYVVRADGRAVEGKTYVYLQKEGDRWLISGIVEES